MAVLKIDLPTPEIRKRLARGVSVYRLNGQIIARAYRPARGRATEGSALVREMELAFAGKNFINSDINQRETAERLTKGALWTWKDLLVALQYGTIFDIALPDGSICQPARMLLPEAQSVLDTICSEVGSMLVRTEVGWLGLLPGEEGFVLTVGSGVPGWYPPTDPFTGGILINGPADLLHQIVTQSGSTIAIDRVQGENVTVTLTENVTSITIASWPAPPFTGKVRLILKNPNSYAVSGWPAATEWVGGLPPTITAPGTDIILLMSDDGGTTLTASIVGQDYHS